MKCTYSLKSRKVLTLPSIMLRSKQHITLSLEVSPVLRLTNEIPENATTQHQDQTQNSILLPYLGRCSPRHSVQPRIIQNANSALWVMKCYSTCNIYPRDETTAVFHYYIANVMAVELRSLVHWDWIFVVRTYYAVFPEANHPHSFCFALIKRKFSRYDYSLELLVVEQTPEGMLPW